VVIIQKTANLLPEEGIIGIDLAPMYFLQVPVHVSQYVNFAAPRPIDDTHFLFNVREGYGRVVPQFLNVPYDIGAAVAGVPHDCFSYSAFHNAPLLAGHGRSETMEPPAFISGITDKEKI
jgi:hypothetical protein